MKLRTLSGVGTLAVVLSATAYASEPRELPTIIDEIVVTAKRPQIEEIIVTAKRPKELVSEETDNQPARVEVVALPEWEPPQAPSLVF